MNGCRNTINMATGTWQRVFNELPPTLKMNPLNIGGGDFSRFSPPPPTEFMARQIIALCLADYDRLTDSGKTFDRSSTPRNYQ